MNDEHVQAEGGKIKPKDEHHLDDQKGVPHHSDGCAQDYAEENPRYRKVEIKYRRLDALAEFLEESFIVDAAKC